MSDPQATTTWPLPHVRPDMTVRMTLLTTAEGGQDRPISRGFRCIAMLDPAAREGNDVIPLLETPMEPGETRDVPVTFLTKEGARRMREAGRFHLWGGRIIGTAEVLPEDTDEPTR